MGKGFYVRSTPEGQARRVADFRRRKAEHAKSSKPAPAKVVGDFSDLLELVELSADSRRNATSEILGMAGEV